MGAMAGRARAARRGLAVGVVLLVSALGLPVAHADTVPDPASSSPPPEATAAVKDTPRPSTPTLAAESAPPAAIDAPAAAVVVAAEPAVPPTPSPALSISPDTGLVDLQTVTVNGAGFRPGSFLLLDQCATGAPWCSFFSPPLTVGANGAFVTTAVVHTRLPAPSGTVNCLDAPCELRVSDFGDSGYDTSVPLSFDPGGPQPTIPVITVTPSTGLTDGQTEVVVGTGFDASADVFVQQCPVAELECSPATLGYAQADSSGSFSIEVRARRIVGRYTPTGVERVDCALTPCEVTANQYADITLVASAAVAFDPAVPPPPSPTITAAPTTGLAYRQPVTVQGQGFTPGTFVYVSTCGNAPNVSVCTGGPGTVVDASGGITVTVIARRFLAFDETQEPIDCASAAGTCELQVSSDDVLESSSVPLTFDPNAPIPPPPTMTVDPATGLGYRQAVTIHATGFAPGDEVQLAQCLPDPETGFTGPCSGYQTAIVDASGNVETSVTVRRTLSNGFEPPVDCAAAPGTCVVTISMFGAVEHATAPLSFDPDAPIPLPPSLTATPATGLTDGQNVALAGSGFTPNASIGFALCADGALSLNRCDITHAGFATADTEGNFTGEFLVSSTIETNEGTIDCGAAPGTCFIGAADLSDYIENGRAPVSFGPEIAIRSVVVSERYGSAALAAVTVALSGPSTRDVRVHWTTVDGSAVAPSDYLAGAGDLVFAPGETSKVIWLGIVADGTRRRDEHLFVDLSAPQAGSIAPDGTRAVLTIPGDGDGDHHHHDDAHHDDGDHHHGGHHQDTGHHPCHRF